MLIYASQFVNTKKIQLSFVFVGLQNDEREKLLISREKKGFLDETKIIFHSFRRTTI